MAPDQTKLVPFLASIEQPVKALYIFLDFQKQLPEKVKKKKNRTGGQWNDNGNDRG